MSLEKMVLESNPVRRGKKLYAVVDCDCCGQKYYMRSKDCDFVGCSGASRVFYANVRCCNCGFDVTGCHLVEEDQLEFPEDIENE